MNYQELFETIKGFTENDFPDTSWTDSAGTGTTTFTSTEQINTFIEQADLLPPCEPEGLPSDEDVALEIRALFTLLLLS